MKKLLLQYYWSRMLKMKGYLALNLCFSSDCTMKYMIIYYYSLYQSFSLAMIFRFFHKSNQNIRDGNLRFNSHTDIKMFILATF